jgi:DNA-binding transcriptional MerR regulator
VRAGEVARRAGVSVETLRYYERRHLLPEPPREAGGHRRYDEDAVRFVRAIKDAQAIGFTLAEIEEYLRAVRRGRVPAPEALRVRMAAKIDEIDTRIATLRRMRGSSGARASRSTTAPAVRLTWPGAGAKPRRTQHRCT